MAAQTLEDQVKELAELCLKMAQEIRLLQQQVKQLSDKKPEFAEMCPVCEATHNLIPNNTGTMLRCFNCAHQFKRSQ